MLLVTAAPFSVAFVLFVVEELASIFRDNDMDLHQLETPKNLGGRRSCAKFRQSLDYAENFEGLPDNVTRYDLLKLVKQAGREIGFTNKMIALLEYYLVFTQDQDWEHGSRPIIYQSLCKTALDFGCGERQIQKLEQALFNIGALTWNDSGNHKRYGVRCAQTGAIQYAFGVDLSPLASLYGALTTALQDKQMRDAAWLEAKRKISWYRARMRAFIAELDGVSGDDAEHFSAAYTAIALPIRAHMQLETVLDMQRQHQALFSEIESRVNTLNTSNLTQKKSSKGDQNDTHKYSTNKESFDKSNNSSSKNKRYQNSVEKIDADPSSIPESNKHNLHKIKYPDITLKQILNSASPRFLDHMPIEPRPMNEADFIEAATSLVPLLGINRSIWGQACLSLGRMGAAICVVIIDQKMQSRDYKDRIRNAGGYLRAMITKAQDGELNLHASIFGLLKRHERDEHDHNML